MWYVHADAEAIVDDATGYDTVRWEQCMVSTALQRKLDFLRFAEWINACWWLMT
jgi:hypothetical protein